MSEFEEQVTDHMAGCYQSHGISEEGSQELAGGQRPSNPVDQAVLGSYDATQPLNYCNGLNNMLKGMNSVNDAAKQAIDDYQGSYAQQHDIRWAVDDSNEIVNKAAYQSLTNGGYTPEATGTGRGIYGGFRFTPPKT